MTNHLSWDTLNDVVDGRVAASERAHVDTHLRDCAVCRETVETLRTTIADADALPPDVALPATLWTDIRRSIDAGKVTAIPTAAPARVRGWWMTPRRIAVAAVVLIAGSSALTAVVVRRQAPTSVVASSQPMAGVLPVQWQAAERGYLNSASELREQLDAQRNRLNPATIATVERSLATIDAAIAEAREALIRDPASTTLSELLASNYRQKVDLLRRATQLMAST
ncbi:MAG: hypothetical protein H7066_09155 [Cytophagaceae bacterium]|nr:hypothetical protein [Gemmatimonadaceae bacterium]